MYLTQKEQKNYANLMVPKCMSLQPIEAENPKLTARQCSQVPNGASYACKQIGTTSPRQLHIMSPGRSLVTLGYLAKTTAHTIMFEAQ
jgi:hypothetical protein